MDRIRLYFDNQVELTDSDWAMFSANLVKKEYPKNTILLHVGTTENQLSFIEEGTVRSYIVNEGNDITFDLAFRGEFVSAYESFICRSPATYRLETLADTTLFSITHADLQQLYHQRKIGNIIGRLATENLYLRRAHRELSLLGETPEERYRNLIKDRSEIISNIPPRIIASYLGITVQALSRMIRIHSVAENE